MAMKRIQKELIDLGKESLPNVSAGPRGDSLFEWEATLLGPGGTPFEDGCFFLDIAFPQEYPIKPPVIKFTTKVG